MPSPFERRQAPLTVRSARPNRPPAASSSGCLLAVPYCAHFLTEPILYPRRCFSGRRGGGGSGRQNCCLAAIAAVAATPPTWHRS